MIPPADRHAQPTTAEMQSQIEAWALARHVLDAVAGIEKRTEQAGNKVGSLAVFWDTVSVLLALLRREAEARGVSWEEVEHKVNADSKEWLRVLRKGK